MINKIKSAEQFNDSVKKYFSKKYVNNAQTLIKNYKEMIENNALFYLERPEYILYFEDCVFFYNLYYFILSDDVYLRKEDVDFKIPIVLNDIYSDKIVDKEYLKNFLNVGFEKYLTRNYKVLNINSEEQTILRKNFFAKENDLEEILKIQYDSIDKYTGNILNRENMRNAILNENVLVLRDFKNVIGYLKFSKNKNIVTLDSIAIKEEYRGKGHSKELMNIFIEIFLNKDFKKIDLWVRNDNINAIKLYDFFKFKDSKYICDNYIKF